MTGRVIELWRFPVKSMQGEPLEQAAITEGGLPGDRAYGLVDVETGTVASAKSVRLFADLMMCRAAFLGAPRVACEAPPVRIDLPNGRSVRSDSDAADRALSAYFGRQVRLVRAAPGVRTADQYQPAAGDVASAGRRAMTAEMKADAADSPVPAGAFRDVYPMSVLTTSTLERLNELRPESCFDSRRFRMNLIVETGQPGFIENDWIGRELAFGDGARLSVAARDPRCIMTTLPQGNLSRDPDILRTIARYNRVQVAPSGERPCAGVYASVIAPGTIRADEHVALV